MTVLPSSPRRPVRPRTWRRALRALARSGRARVARPEDGATADGEGVLVVPPGPQAVGLREDRGPLHPAGRPRQGALGDCWVVACMLAVHETAPERLAGLVTAAGDGTAAVHLPGLAAPLRVRRELSVDDRGRFLYARRDGANPGDVGVLEAAIAGHVAGGYGWLQRGVARYGLELLLGGTDRTLLRLPRAEQILRWREQGRAMTASTHPLSPRVLAGTRPFRASHVYAIVGAEAASGHVLLRDPGEPGRVLRVDAGRFRRGVLSVDVSMPLR